MPNEFESYPPAVERTLQVLDYLGSSTEPKSIKEISAALQIPPASAYRMIRCLIGYGYLRESRSSADKYQLGYKINVLARATFEGLDLCEAAHPYMETLAKETGQACQLCVLSDNSAMIIDQALPTAAITIIAKLGAKVPINVSAGGRLLTALLPKEKQRAFLNNAWKIAAKNTVNTVDSLPLFASSLKEIEKQGFATDIEEYAIGIGCLAVPVCDAEHRPIAAVGLTGQIDNYRDPERFSAALEKLRAVSASIEKEILFK